ncbi:MAG: hypothetical protein COW03_12250 [Cytophagales bacterium CG12_big_fil_rev_8_21_14_0_65_40_12]|nr:MAG: hypothetical protein COW03_12250 [Cytophagales bacterium CG12_big_fil_rev_8_21_14_0_65_40_12]PIW04868.1 MAG: hypothetical protein COW40_07335 [Cytophagales bacterium CG17_big_fil_post_rev_8_21_14_2_50_40_13]
MMKLKYILLVATVSASCSIKSNTINDFQRKLMSISKDELVISEFDKVLIIPGAGCTGCVSSAENFVMENFERIDRILVIFTAIPSQKMLKMKLGIDLNRQNVYLDKDNEFNAGNIYSFYPTVFYLKDGKAIKFEYVSPENKDVLNRLLDE